MRKFYFARNTLFALLFLWILWKIIKLLDDKSSRPCFRASVFEYHPGTIGKSLNFKSIQQNLNVYLKAATIAANHGAELIVFPENGLYNCPNRSTVYQFLEYLPEPSDHLIPCYQIESGPIAKQLSCYAQSTNLYIAAVMGEKVACDVKKDPRCPSDGRYQFNTQVLFDPKGQLIGKYHKYNLFFENQFDRPNSLEIVSVSTTLGTFGLLVCFDILFQQPIERLINEAKVDTLLFPSNWIDELPFLCSHQVQSAISQVTRINLIAANLNDLKKASLGSGLYSGSSGLLGYTHETRRQGSRLVIADLPKSPNNYQFSCPGSTETIELNYGKPIKTDLYKPWQLNLTLFNHVKLTKSFGNQKICFENTCCSVNYDLNSLEFVENFYLIVFQWIRPTTKICEQFCGLVTYDDKLSSYSNFITTMFSYIRLEAEFEKGKVLPSVLSNNLEIVPSSKWKFITHKNNFYSIILDKLNYVINSVTLYSRCFDRDKMSNQ